MKGRVALDETIRRDDIRVSIPATPLVLGSCATLAGLLLIQSLLADPPTVKPGVTPVMQEIGGVLTLGAPSVTVFDVAGWWFTCSLGKPVEFTHERREHIREYHADVFPCLDRLANVLARPDELRRSLSDPETVLFYKYYPDIRNGKYMVAAVKVGEERSFILTVYMTQTIRTGTPL